MLNENRNNARTLLMLSYKTRGEHWLLREREPAATTSNVYVGL